MADINSISNNLGARSEAKQLQGADSRGLSPFEKGVVTKIVLDQSQIPLIASSVKGIDPAVQLDRLPRNTLLVRRITDGADSVGQSLCIAYPFFSSHVSMPVKVGETVWLVFDRDIRTVGYWLTRVHGDEYSEDLNFSHYDRGIVPKAELKQTPGTAEKAQALPSGNAPATDDFPNFSLRQETSGKNEYVKILDEATAIPHKLEPVPRYSKRPGDLVIHGSNNAMVALTTDRGWNRDEDLSASRSKVHESPGSFSGAVDIVAGRSRWLSNNEKSRTVPDIMTNSRGFIEVSKDVRKKPGLTQVEGDPDFDQDASRIYIVISSPLDERLSLADFMPVVPGEESYREFPQNNSGIAIKSDQVRIVARKDEAHNINGSIKIIKEGEKSDTGDHAAISLLEDGTVIVTGSKIFIGKSAADGGLEEGDEEAPGKTQPYVKYQQLKELLETFLDNIDSFCAKLQTHTTPGYGAPSVQILDAATTLKSDIASRKSEIPDIRSKRIYGE